jgi:hypothetical protein
MKTLVFGASGATGKLVVSQLLERNLSTRILVRETAIIPVASNIIEWVAVRPDTLFNEENQNEYEICESKTRSPIFNSGKTSRINVSHFIVDLLVNDNLWQKWKYKTPVIYSKE